MTQHGTPTVPGVTCNDVSSTRSREASADAVHVNTLRSQEARQTTPQSMEAEQVFHQANSETSSDDKTLIPSTIFLRPNHIEEGDPLQDDSKLFQGPRVGIGESETSNTIKKSSSSQALPRFRWGTDHRTSGRSKTGLRIQVPIRGTPATATTSCFLHDKSIIYTYTSSSSGGSNTTHSFGAIGDHLSPRGYTPSTAPSTKPMYIVASRQAPASAGEKLSSPLQGLVASSIPEYKPYELCVVGESGPLGRSIVPRVIGPSNIGVMPPRRRSLTDLVDAPARTFFPPSVPNVMSALGTNGHDDVASLHRQQTHLQTSRHHLSDSMGPTSLLEPPVWVRRGPPRAVEGNLSGQALSGCHDFDPPTFSLPFDSTVFMMKTDNITNMRMSVSRGVWSSAEGANKVFQSAWENKSSEQKVIFLFSITHSGKFSGIAEMIGAYDRDASSGFLSGKRKCVKGAIPIRWIVTKDVSFATFDELEYRGIPITQVRHANKIPGEIGRRTIQAYFETPHASTAILHPSDRSFRPPAVIPTLKQHKTQTFQQDNPPDPARYRGPMQQDTYFQGPAVRHSTFPGRPYPEITITERNGIVTRIPMRGSGSLSIHY